MHTAMISSDRTVISKFQNVIPVICTLTHLGVVRAGWMVLKEINCKINFHLQCVIKFWMAAWQWFNKSIIKSIAAVVF